MKRIVAFSTVILTVVCLLTACTFPSKEHTHSYDNDTDTTCNDCGYERSTYRLFSEGLAPIKMPHGHGYGYIDEDGNVAIEFQFSEAENFQPNGLAVAKPKDSSDYGYIDKTGKFVIEPQFDRAMDFSEGFALVRKDGLYTFINEKGEPLTEYQFKDLTDSFVNGFAKVIIDYPSKCAYLDKNGKLLGDKIFDSGSRFDKNGIAAVCVDGKYGYIDTTGNYVLEPQYDLLMVFGENEYAIVQSGDKYGFINKEYKIVIEPQFEMVNKFTASGLAAVKKDGKWGYIDTTGNMVIEPTFDRARDFEYNGRAVVSVDGKEGIIDTEGNYIVPLEYEEGAIGMFREDRAIALWDGKYGYIDSDGKVMAYYKYDNYSFFGDNGVAVVSLKDKNKYSKYGCIDRDGNVIVPIEYWEVVSYADGYVICSYTPENKPSTFRALKIIRVSDGSTILDLDPQKYTPKEN